MLDMNSRASADRAPSPEGGWSCSVRMVASAVLVPPETSATVQPCGVQEAGGDFVGHSATWRGRRQMMTPPPEPVRATERLAGRHLFAGQHWTHFGHFLSEGLSRLWALDHLDEPPQSILFLPKRPGRSQNMKGYQREFFGLLGIDLPVRVIERPTEVEELVVPGQGFGLGEIADGTAPFRDFFANRFARDVKPDGPEGLYLSRSALGGLEGTALGEAALERSLARDGIEPLHPQQMSLADQVARYRAARRVVGLDGSALHLFGFVGRPHQKAAIILRRSSAAYQPIRQQIAAFCGIEPAVIEAIAADWIPDHKSRPGRYSFGEFDYEALAGQLHAAGFGPRPEDWDIPSFRQMKQEMKRFARKKDVTFRRVKPRKNGGDRDRQEQDR